MTPCIVSIAALLLAGGGPGSHKLLGPAEILERLDRSKTSFEITSTESAPDVPAARYADLLWPRSGGDIQFPKVIAELGGEPKVVEATLSPEALRTIRAAEPSFREGNYEAAAAQYERGLRDDPKSFLLLSNLGDCHFQRGRYAEALRLYERAIEILPTDHRLWFYKGQALVHLGRRAEAIDAFVEALVLRPRYALLLEWLAKNADVLRIRVEKDPLFVPRSFVRREGEGVRLYVDAKRPHWLAFASCKALWLGEPSRSKEAHGSSRPLFSSIEERECLASLLAAYDSRRREKGFVPEPSLDRLVEIVEGGFTDGFILYELGSRVTPWCTLVTGKDAQQAVSGFVRNFVLVRSDG